MNVKSLLQHLMALSILLSTTGVFAQKSYTFSKITSTYLEISGATILSTDLQAANYFVPLHKPLTIFGNKTGTNLAVGKNAYITTTGPQYSFAIDPLTMNLSKKDASSSLSYKYEAAGSDSVLIIQWKNMKLDSGIAGDYINMQCKIYLNSQDIEFHYGPVQASSPKFADTSLSNIVGIFWLSKDFNTAYETYWLRGDAQNPEVNYNANAEVRLKGLPANGVVYRFAKKSTAGINELLAPQFTIYPNPATHELFFESDANNEITGITLTNMAGQILQSIPATNLKSTINVAALPAGMYYITVETDKGSSTQKFIKQ